ncbi:hypothetical protein CF15_00570 [Pyrodictium occultum]|uniref:Cystathionine gamma-synthase n=1 Tax=Pyrodictium occultum TaxID=2309 RepID=A0A0V8RTS9_PYROC|nr:PLP-dependent transferase [Pyrodictium occultum]KSW11394.1 hypothetical protein CF15_00570 [Pyrodictium occultum]
MKRYKATRAIHGVHEGPITAEDVVPPINISVVYRFIEAATSPDEEIKYGRENNPTTMRLESTLAEVESGEWCLAFNTGMAAIATLILSLAGPRRRIVASRLLYGSTRTLLEKLTTVGKDFELAYAGPPWDELLAAMKPGDIVLVETIGNPTLRVPPLREMAKECINRECTLVVDNTFATPVIYRPLEDGASIVVESLTKYIAGHNDVLGGAICGREPGLRKRVWEWRKLMGTILQPLDAYLAARGLKTLHLRVRYSSESAMTIAKWLRERPEVAKVYYPGLPEHPDHGTAEQLFNGLYGGVVSFELKGGAQAAKRFLQALKTVTPSPSLGGAESLAAYPYESSHRDLSEEEKRRLGITPGLIRLSVGLEDPEDIISDLESALMKARG